MLGCGEKEGEKSAQLGEKWKQEENHHLCETVCACVHAHLVIHVAAIITPTPDHPWRTPTTPFMSMCVCVRAIKADGSLCYHINYITVTSAMLFSGWRTMPELFYTNNTPATALEPADFLQHLHLHGVTDAQFEVTEGNTDGWLVACFQTSLNLAFCKCLFLFFSFFLRNLSGHLLLIDRNKSDFFVICIIT